MFDGAARKQTTFASLEASVSFLQTEMVGLANYDTIIDDPFNPDD